MHTNTKHGHTPVDTNSPTLSMYSGALQILCNSSNCTFWGFTILTSYVSATGLCWRDQLKWKGPTCPSCYDPPRCGHRSGCPSSRCDPGEASWASSNVCACGGHTPVSAMSHPLAHDAIELSMRWIGLWCRCNVRMGFRCICVALLTVCVALAFL